MSKVWKKVVFICLCIFCFALLICSNVFASDNKKIQVNFIFNNLSYSGNDIVTVHVNITNIDYVSEIKMGINKSEETNKFIEFIDVVNVNKSSGFKNELINKVDEVLGLRLHLQKEEESLEEGVCEIKLKCKKDISDIISVLSKDLTIYLFGKDNKLLDYEIVYSEKLKATWNVVLDELEVYSLVPNYVSSFFVLNREEEEYEVVLKETIDSSVIGTQVISIVVIDKLNNDRLLFNKPIHVVDKTVPCLSYPSKIEINDTQVDKLELSDYIDIVDNYDNNAQIEYSYYNKEKQEIGTFSLFKEYLKYNKEGLIKFYGVDSSNNKTEEVTLEIVIEDISSPVITTSFTDKVIIKDVNLEEFNLNTSFSIIDNYDNNPLLVLEIYDSNNNLVEDYKESLLEGTNLELRYYGIDNANNKTPLKKVPLILEDTTPPVISGNTDITINDVDVTDSFYLDGVVYSDNIDKMPILEIMFYIGEEKVSKYLFLEKIKKGEKGCVSLQAIDSSNNKSDVLLKRIEVIDTTPPIINILDIKDGGKYIKLEEIVYEVSDNFKEEVEVYVEVNGHKYENTLISEVGSYEVKVYAKDKSGNETIKKLNFTIIENNLNGCDGDIKCYIDNYTNVIIVVSVLTIVSVGLVVIKLIVEKKKEKSKIKEIKNENIE